MTSEKYFKGIEAAQAPPVLPRDDWWIIRVDGRAFHTYTKYMVKPYDRTFIHDMDETAKALCEEIQNARLAFVQSDEISVLVKAEGEKSQTWFGGDRDKVVSVSAAIASAQMTYENNGRMAQFDSRVFTVSSPLDVERYFMWRQRDAWVNAVTMIAEAHFTAKELHGRSTAERVDMTYRKTGKEPYELAPAGFLRGRIVRPHHVPTTTRFFHKKELVWKEVEHESRTWRAEVADWFEEHPVL